MFTQLYSALSVFALGKYLASKLRLIDLMSILTEEGTHVKRTLDKTSN